MKRAGEVVGVFLFLSAVMIVGLLVGGTVTSWLITPAHSQGANFRFTVAGYGGSITTSAAYDQATCRRILSEIQQPGWKYSDCEFSSGQ